MKILFTLILWHFWIPFDKTGYKQNAESIRTSINIVICSQIILKFDEVPTTDFLPESQLSIFTGKCHILFVYLRDSNGVNTGDR